MSKSIFGVDSPGYNKEPLIYYFKLERRVRHGGVWTKGDHRRVVRYHNRGTRKYDQGTDREVTSFYHRVQVRNVEVWLSDPVLYRERCRGQIESRGRT